MRVGRRDGYTLEVQPRTVGLEEELLLVDPRTRRAVPRAAEVLTRHRRETARSAGEDLDQELFRHQLEIRSEPARAVGDAVGQLAAARAHAIGDAAEVGLAVAACSTVVLGGHDPVLSPQARYRDMVETYGEIVSDATTCGMHVHVEVESPDEGVGCLDRIAPWLPVLLALSCGSPFHLGRDTSYASWRTQMWSRWPAAGPHEAFGSLAGYRSTVESLIAVGAARDPGMLYFDARLSEAQPTLEVRVLDVCTDLDDTAVLAALVRALVETAAAEWAAGRPAPRWRSELLGAATWRASRFGLGDTLVHPERRELAPATEVVEALVSHTRARLDAAGDLDRVVRGAARLAHGTGADRQREVLARRGSFEDVVDDLVARTARDG